MLHTCVWMSICICDMYALLYTYVCILGLHLHYVCFAFQLCVGAGYAHTLCTQCLFWCLVGMSVYWVCTCIMYALLYTLCMLGMHIQYVYMLIAVSSRHVCVTGGRAMKLTYQGKDLACAHDSLPSISNGKLSLIVWSSGATIGYFCILQEQRTSWLLATWW